MPKRNVTGRIRLPSREQWARIGLLASMLAAYHVTLADSYSRFGGLAFTVSLVPVVVAAALLGVRYALLTVIVIAWIDRSFVLSSPDTQLGRLAGALALLAKAIVGAVVGWLRALMVRLGRVNADLEQAMAARQAITENLRRSLELHRSLVESMGEGVGLFDREDRFLFANQAAQRILQAPPSGLLGVKVTDLLSQQGRQGLFANRQRALPGPVSYDAALKQDPERILLITETRFEYETSGGMQTLRVFRDVSERARLEQEQRELEVQVQRTQALQTMAVLVGGVAHDFNNLLGGVLGNAELALLRLPDPGPSPVRTCLAEIRRFAQEAAELSKRMVGYAGRRAPTLESVELNRIVQDVLELLGSVIARRARLELDLGQHLPSLRGDPVQLRQVVMNLTMNAAESMEATRGVLTLRTSHEQLNMKDLSVARTTAELGAGPYLVLTVQDTGVGMSDATLQRVFEPFFSTKLAGRGIGLAATLGIVKAHHGVILVTSTAGRGSTFRVAFPVPNQLGAAAEYSPKSPRPSELEVPTACAD
jgi:PAS domain S-box-containing protein